MSQERLSLHLLRSSSKYGNDIALLAKKSRMVFMLTTMRPASCTFHGREVVEVLEDSPDAKKWPLWQPPDKEEPSVTSSTAPTTEIDINTGTTSTSATFTPGKRPGPRKPKTQLPELPRQSSTRATKLTTLNKSVMDWKAHVQSSEYDGLQDELDANRRGGGYLEKVEFLQRVDDRKEAMLEAAKSTKRKRG